MSFVATTCTDWGKNAKMKTPKLNLVVIAGLLASISGANAGDVADKPAVLSVTWFVEGQPPATTNTPMSSLKACLLAKAHAEAAGEQARNERIRLNEQDKADVLEGRVSNPSYSREGA